MGKTTYQLVQDFSHQQNHGNWKNFKHAKRDVRFIFSMRSNFLGKPSILGHFWKPNETMKRWVVPLPRMPVTSRIVIFLVGNPELNLRLPLLLGGGNNPRYKPCFLFVLLPFVFLRFSRNWQNLFLATVMNLFEQRTVEQL